MYNLFLFILFLIIWIFQGINMALMVLGSITLVWLIITVSITLYGLFALYILKKNMDKFNK